jgi:hypothetical protein
LSLRIWVDHYGRSLWIKARSYFYRPQGEGIAIDVLAENETVWLTQTQMTKLLETTKQNIGQHIRNAFKDGELVREVVVKKFFTTTLHGAMSDKTQTHLGQGDGLIAAFLSSRKQQKARKPCGPSGKVLAQNGLQPRLLRYWIAKK